MHRRPGEQSRYLASLEELAFRTSPRSSVYYNCQDAPMVTGITMNISSDPRKTPMEACVIGQALLGNCLLTHVSIKI